MDFPTIHTNFWDVIIAVPVIMVLTQLIKIFLKIPRIFVPMIALVLGLCFSILISHRQSLAAGIFMGWFYGYGAIGTYASLKTTIQAYRNSEE
jgi:MFS superfamily sulfate permease-like transporter